MNTKLRHMMLVLSLVSGAALAAGDPGGASSAPSRRVDPVLEKVGAATANKDWLAAQGVLKDALQKDPNNADYHSLYAYTIRKGANPDMSLVFKHYNQALSIDPKHKGAHEYIGEAYLMVGNVEKAREHLAQLDKICFFSCSEFTELKNAIGDFEKRVASKQ